MPHMGSEEMGTFPKMLEQTPSSTTGAMQPHEWAAFQAFYSSSMTPMPLPNPYMWGAQPVMPPYGTPPFTSIYPHGGMYAHPSMSAGNHPYSPYGLAAGNMRDVQGALVPDAEGKSKYGNANSPPKTSNGSLGNLARPNGQKLEPLASINEYGSYSADSRSEGSTEGSEENSLIGITDQLFPKAPSRDSRDVNLFPKPMSMSGTQCVGVEANTNLNSGTNPWNGVPSLCHSGGQDEPGGSVTLATALASPTSMRGHAQDRVARELCFQDERDLKRQRRKQSNRESARRSRLRKQTECEELATQMEALSQENKSLRSKLSQINEEHKMLSKQNCSLLGQLQVCKPEDVHRSMDENTKFFCQEILEGNMKLPKESLHIEAKTIL